MTPEGEDSSTDLAERSGSHSPDSGDNCEQGLDAAAAVPAPKTSLGQSVVGRIERLNYLELTPQRLAFRRVAAEMRDIIEGLTATTATAEQLDAAASELSTIAETLRAHPKGRPYEGFAEIANAVASGTADEHRLAELAAELHATFDHSPFIGLANPLSPPLSLTLEGDRVLGTVTFGSAYEGPPGCVHGGYIAAAFDETLGSAQAISGVQGMTAYLHIDYRSPTPLRRELSLAAWVHSVEGRKVVCRGTISVGDTLCAEAEGLFIGMNPEKFRSLLSARDAR